MSIRPTDRPSVSPLSPNISGAFDSCGGEIVGVLLLHGFFPSIPRRRFSHFISPSFFFFPPFQLFFLSRFFFFPFPLYFFISRGQKRGVEGGGERKAGVVVCSTLFPFPPFLHFPRRERKRSGGREAEYLPLLDIFCAKGPAAHVCSSFAHKNILKIKKKPVNNYFSQIQCIR